MVVTVDIEGIVIVLNTDNELLLRSFLEVTRKETVYNPRYKQWRNEDVVTKIYEGRIKRRASHYSTFQLGLGWAAYLASVLKPYITQEDYMKLIRSIMADQYRTLPFQGLRDYQNDDILHILKYKLGLFTVYTGYGKTQVIATLANYAVRELGKKVMLITPGKKAEDELVKRCKTVFDLDVKRGDTESNLCCLCSNGASRSKKFKDPALLKIEKENLGKFDWVLVDEVEYTINPGGELLFSLLTGADHFLAFSGSADKYGGKCISFANGIDEVVARNKDLVKYFGPSLVFRMPLTLDISNITVMTSAFDNIQFNKAETMSDKNVYLEVMSKIWTTPEICEVICKLIDKYPKLYIPVNNLANIISVWINGYFKGRYRVLLICGSGYIYYDLNGNITKLSLTEACDYIKGGKVDVIPSTSAGFRALDFPGLENILLIAGKVAGVVLQTAGRVARSSHMNVISLYPRSGKKIPVYTKGMKHRNEMLQEYYKYCKSEDIVVDESSL